MKKHGVLRDGKPRALCLKAALAVFSDEITIDRLFFTWSYCLNPGNSTIKIPVHKNLVHKG